MLHIRAGLGYTVCDLRLSSLVRRVSYSDGRASLAAKARGAEIVGEQFCPVCEERVLAAIEPADVSAQPFSALPGDAVASEPAIPAAIRARLVRFYGEEIVAFAEARGTRMRVLAAGEKYASASGALSRMAVDVDSWPAPPAGLFVLAERTVYLRVTSDMTIAHEFAHALDLALGGESGLYRSAIDTRVRRAFCDATAFVTPSAASALDEYFAECVRAYVGVNDPGSMWPAVSRERLWALDPRMGAIIGDLFAEARLAQLA